jgi:single-stranded-DNA-specific exonuclease
VELTENIYQEPVWIYPQPKEDWTQKIVDEFAIHPISASILSARGFDSMDQIHTYLYAQLPDLHDPKLFLDMPTVVRAIARAVKEGRGILIYGDNDVDGITGTVLLTEFIKKVGGNVFFYIPNHNLERGELFVDALSYAKENNCTLMITVDCGITAAKEIKKVTQSQVDVIITDHHEPTEKIPHCLGTLNPKLLKQTYPNRELTGVGVAFKLAHALTNFLVATKEISPKKIDLKVFLDLVALGTIADMGALQGENRILVRYGLKELQKTKRVGLQKLLQVCGVEASDVTTVDVASKIAPRINSLGRVADPKKGVQLLLTRNEKKAEALAQELDLFNSERQKIEQVVAKDVEQYLEKHPEVFKNKAIVLSSENWHPGVIPIICARVAKHYNRPTLLISVDDGIGKGSMRTIREFPLLPVLKKSADLFLNYGGHDFAAGLLIPQKNIEQFKKRFIHAANSSLQEQDMILKLMIDARADFKDLNYDLLSSLELFEPYGNENPTPILYTEAKQTWMPKVIGGNHLKLYLEQDDRMLEGIAFGMADRQNVLKKKNLKLRIAYTPQVNRFHNKSSIQLLIRDFQII